MESHLDAAAGPQGRNRVRLDVLAGYELEAVSLDNHGDNQLGFHERELVADTLAGAAPERKIRIAGTLSDPLGRETFGLKAFGVVPKRGVAVGDIRAQDHQRAGRDRVAVNVIVISDTARQRPGRGIQPQGLLDDHPGVGQPWDVLDGRGTTAEDFIKLGVNLTFDVGMLGQQIPTQLRVTAVVS